MAMFRASLPALAITAALGLGTGALAVVLAGGNARQCGSGDDSALAARVAELEAELARRPTASTSAVATAGSRAGQGAIRAAGGRQQHAGPLAVASPPDVDQQLKDLLTLAWNDHRGMREKLDDFIAAHPGSEGIAIASKGVFELVDNRDVLPDTALAELYLEQQDPAFKRVLAQVASTRGDNSLIELHIAEAAAGLHGATPAERQQALVELARSRHVAAADRAAPLLRDRDTGVVLDALLALRATGNQRHVRMVEGLLDHPDESVRWLAADVGRDLRMLSNEARTRIDEGELAAELPPLPLADANGVQRCGPATG
ncbi:MULTISPECIES: hypothetical protein [unclassified Luteimonas]